MIFLNLKKFIQRIRFHLARFIYPEVFKITSSIKSLVIRTPRPAINFIKKYFKNKSLVGAEIGVYEGSNSLSILKELNIKRLFLIDIWASYNKTNFRSHDFGKILKIFENKLNVSIIRDFSVMASRMFYNKSLDFCYIDANHTFQYCYDDIYYWFPKVKKGGVLCGHDIHSYGVRKAVIFYCLMYGLTYKIDFPDFYIIK